MSPMYYGNLNCKEFIDYIKIIAPTIKDVKKISLNDMATDDLNAMER